MSGHAGGKGLWLRPPTAPSSPPRVPPRHPEPAPRRRPPRRLEELEARPAPRHSPTSPAAASTPAEDVAAASSDPPGSPQPQGPPGSPPPAAPLSSPPRRRVRAGLQAAACQRAAFFWVKLWICFVPSAGDKFGSGSGSAPPCLCWLGGGITPSWPRSSGAGASGATEPVPGCAPEQPDWALLLSSPCGLRTRRYSGQFPR